MSTWFIWPHGGLPARMAVLGFAFAAFPLAAGFAILRRGLYGIDVVINRTAASYGSVTAVLAAAFAATVILLLGTALGRGSPWTTAVAHARSSRLRSVRCGRGCRTRWIDGSTGLATTRCIA